jgi:hypothetical protein
LPAVRVMRRARDRAAQTHRLADLNVFFVHVPEA